MMNSRIGCLIVLVISLVTSSSVRAEDFALRDGDTVVFLGDSLTAARTYGKFIENLSSG